MWCTMSKSILEVAPDPEVKLVSGVFKDSYGDSSYVYMQVMSNYTAGAEVMNNDVEALYKLELGAGRCDR